MTPRRLIIVAVAFALLVAMGAWALRPVSRPFDATAWNDEQQVNQGVRLKMADYIVAHRLLSGKSQSDVVAMLGEPPETDYFSDWDLVYWLGDERGWISIDSEWLVVRFDARGRVSDYWIVRD